MPNMLYYGDNLDVLRRYVKDETIDLVYLDPPFKSNQDYNVLFAEKDGSRAAAQIKAFEDTWTWDMAAAAAFDEVVKRGDRLSDAMLAFHRLLGENDMLAYLAMMAPRLVELHRVLTPSGSIYLHCDPTASHYLKILMDTIFGKGNFKNEVIWHYRRWSAQTNRFQRLHDIILFYSKTKTNLFITLYEDYTAGTMKRWKGIKRKTTVLADGSLYQEEDPDGVKGANMGDVWMIPIINANAKERLGYPTQKPEVLLERILLASSKEGDTVLDPFCGCGTAIAVAQKLKRQWIGIDITHLAITLIKNRLRDAFGDGIAKTYTVIGEPVSLPDAAELAQQDPYQFQWWALGLVGARPVEQKKGADKGIDGRLLFRDDRDGKYKQIILSVKAGALKASYVRDLRGVVEREKAEIGVLISMGEETKQMRAEAASAGFYESHWGKHPRIQILTIAELLSGKRIDYPPDAQVNVTFRKAPKAKTEGETPSLF